MKLKWMTLVLKNDLTACCSVVLVQNYGQQFGWRSTKPIPSIFVLKWMHFKNWIQIWTWKFEFLFFFLGGGDRKFWSVVSNRHLLGGGRIFILSIMCATLPGNTKWDKLNCICPSQYISLKRRCLISNLHIIWYNCPIWPSIFRDCY